MSFDLSFAPVSRARCSTLIDWGNIPGVSPEWRNIHTEGGTGPPVGRQMWAAAGEISSDLYQAHADTSLMKNAYYDDFKVIFSQKIKGYFCKKINEYKVLISAIIMV